MRKSLVMASLTPYEREDAEIYAKIINQPTTKP